MIHTDETTEKAVSTLEGLISILEDGKLGYTNAAEHVDSPAIKTDFLEYARERALIYCRNTRRNQQTRKIN